MTPRQSTENREQHTIRAIHPHPARDRQADRREGDGNRKERKTAIMGHRKRPTSSVPVVPHRLIRYDHLIRYHARDDTKQSALTDQQLRIPEPIRPLSFVPPLAPFPLSKSGARRYGKQVTPTPDDAKPPPSASSHPPAPRTDRQGAGNSTARRLEQARNAAHRRRPVSKQARRDTRPDTQPPRSP